MKKHSMPYLKTGARAIIQMLSISFKVACVTGIFALLGLPGIGYARPVSRSEGTAAGTPAAGPGETINSHVPELAPRIDGLVSDGEWRGAAAYNLPEGTVYVLNDPTALYMLVDLATGTKQDAPDSLALTFDINNNATIDRGVDVKLGYAAGDGEACLYAYAGPEFWTGCQRTGSIFQTGWGSTPAVAMPHRFFEIAVSLAEISPSAAQIPRPELPEIPTSLHMGVQIASSPAGSRGLFPANHQADFSQLLTVNLGQTLIKLLILGHPDDFNALKVLDAHKDRTGMPSYMLDWVFVCQLYQSFGYDDPERIKKAIVAYEQSWNIQYVMLVGDSNRFPMRYTITDRPDSENGRAEWAFYSGDIYYADLYEADNVTFEDWDANDDHYFGELHGERLTGVVNFDQVSLTPDIAVGRVPASDTAEVTTYVNKVINYEYTAYNSAWHKQALMVATTDWVGAGFACGTKEYIRNNLLIPEGYVVGELYQTGNSCLAVNPPSSDNINNILNNVGVGFMNYMGHGLVTKLAIPGDYYEDPDLAYLTNQNRLPIVVAIACLTGRYTTEAPYQPYVDVYGAYHNGTLAGETFLNKPPQPSPIQTYLDEAFAEMMLVKRSTGAVGYLGFVTGAQPVAGDLDKAFFELLVYHPNTLGDMWIYMVYRYYQWHPDPGSLGAADWGVVATFAQPWKFHLFGDPSLRIDGVPSRVYVPLVKK